VQLFELRKTDPAEEIFAEGSNSIERGGFEVMLSPSETFYPV
jgi:hypothetical protein